MKYDNMNLIQFQKQFSLDKECEEYLFKLKWPNGYYCEKCQHWSRFVFFAP